MAVTPRVEPNSWGTRLRLAEALLLDGPCGPSTTCDGPQGPACIPAHQNEKRPAAFRRPGVGLRDHGVITRPPAAAPLPDVAQLRPILQTSPQPALVHRQA